MHEKEYREATTNGTIYAPGKHHNWGVNLCWSIGISLSLRKINILSRLITENLQRKTPNKSGNPSAFSLEISTAVKLGYGLKIDENGVFLTPPDDLDLKGMIKKETTPTMEEQHLIYEQCVLAQNLHNLLKTSASQLRNEIYKLCTSEGGSEEDSSEKIKLLKSLVLLFKGDSLTPILDALDVRELNAIENILEREHSSNYLSLKLEVQGCLRERQGAALKATESHDSHPSPGATPQYDRLTQSQHSTTSPEIIFSKKIDGSKEAELLHKLSQEGLVHEVDFDFEAVPGNETFNIIAVRCTTGAEIERAKKIMQGYVADTPAAIDEAKEIMRDFLAKASPQKR